MALPDAGTVIIRWGDASPPQHASWTAAPNEIGPVPHDYPQWGTYTLVVEVWDDDPPGGGPPRIWSANRYPYIALPDRLRDPVVRWGDPAASWGDDDTTWAGNHNP